MSLRLRLLLLSLFTLLLPWAGREYAQRMEAVLRSGQEGALLVTAQTLARVIVADSDTLASFQLSDNATPKYFAPQLSANPLLDGFANEWPEPAQPLPDADATRLGVHGTALYAFVRVNDASVHYENPGSTSAYDRVLIATRDASGVERAWVLSAVAPGPLLVRRASAVAPWQSAGDEETQDGIRGVWRQTRAGFDVELRIPRRLLGTHFAIAQLDELQTPIALQPRALHTAAENLRDRLALYTPPGLRVSLVDRDGWLLARTGSLQADDFDAGTPSFFRWVLGRSEQAPPSYSLPYSMWGPPVDAARQGKSTAIWFRSGGNEPSTVRASIPIQSDAGVVGAIIVEQAGGRLLADRDAALTGLLSSALLAMVAAIAVAFVFAAWLSRRIRRLSVAAAKSLTPKGDVDAALPETDARDELGDLARSYATLLQRFKEYTLYLRTLGSKLSHEFRTPLAIVNSSLDNLAAERPADHAYLQRAREGVTRLQGILTSMTEATRVEQSIETAERVEFDLADLLRGVGQAYAHTFSRHRIQVSVPACPCPFNGAPELIAQMLDKLIDNAVDFCPPNHRIDIALSVENNRYRLSVSNEGPLLAPNAEHRIFEMLHSDRTGEGAKPHLGLGLFIVQLIARFHGGIARAQNLHDLSGVQFEIELPKR